MVSSSVLGTLVSLARFAQQAGRPTTLRSQQQSRAFSVKELSWCSPAGSPNRQNKSIKRPVDEELRPEQQQDHEENEQHPQPQAKFGMVAAMSNNRISGVGGGLPWNLPSDRKFFDDLTRDKVLIMGRNTFQEQPVTLSHISHARATIVVSKTLNTQQQQQQQQQENNPPLSPASHGNILHSAIFVNSFSEALEKAAVLAPASFFDNERRGIEESSSDDQANPSIEEIDCWIAGGEKIYMEALQHPMAQFLYLTVVDTNVEMNDSKTGKHCHGTEAVSIARFPAKYRWDHKFRLVDSPSASKTVHKDGDMTYTRNLYQHINRLRQKK